MDDAAIRDLFERVGPVTIRRMFGGKGIYREGTIFALEVDGEVLLKADAETAPAFAAAGSRQWLYDGKDGRRVAMPASSSASSASKAASTPYMPS